MSASARSRGAASRTLELLQSIAAGDLEFALSELAGRAGLAPSTAHRLLEPWVGRDLIERAGPKAYRVGPGLFRIASLIVRNYDKVLALPGLLDIALA
jgi:DNA-binding IclR family transcriptional regulator